MRKSETHPLAMGGAVTSGARVAPAAQEQLVARKAAGKRTRLDCRRPPRGAAGAAAPSRRRTMSGQLERCEREWHELEGEFQELQVGPGHLVVQLYLRCNAFPFLLPRLWRWDPQGLGVPLVRPGGLGVPLGQPLHLPALQLYIHLGRRVGAHHSATFTPRISFAAESWSVVSEGKFQVCPCGEGLGDRYVLELKENSLAPPPQGLLYPAKPPSFPLLWRGSPLFL